MKEVLLAAAILALPTAINAAGRSHYRSVSVRHIPGGTFVSGGSDRRPVFMRPAPGGTFVSSAPKASFSRPAARGFSGAYWGRSGFASSLAPRTFRVRPFGSSRFVVSRSPAAQDAPAPQNSTVPLVPGSLIRTEGVGFKTAPGGPFAVHWVEAGDRIVFDDGKGQALESNRRVPFEAGTGGNAGSASGRNAITPNE